MARASAKSPEAFRTISEAADALDLPQHVLRFWETRFSQIKPMKRSGGRRYYRPSDIALLQGIRHLLYDEGYTIKGVQRILREQGIAHVVSFAEQKPAAPASHPVSPQSAAPAPTQPNAQPSPEPVRQQPIAQQPTHPDPVRAALASPQPHQLQQPMPPQPAQQAPVAPQTLVAPPPVSSSSSLRFVAEPEPEPQPQPQQVPLHPSPQPVLSQAVLQPVSQPQQPIASQPLPDPVPPAAPPVLDTATPAPSVAQPTLPPGASDVGGQLAPHQTESLVQALRTLMECKSQLDQARPAPTASPSSQAVET